MTLDYDPTEVSDNDEITYRFESLSDIVDWVTEQLEKEPKEFILNCKDCGWQTTQLNTFQVYLMCENCKQKYRRKYIGGNDAPIEDILYVAEKWLKERYSNNSHI